MFIYIIYNIILYLEYNRIYNGIKKKNRTYNIRKIPFNTMQYNSVPTILHLLWAHKVKKMYSSKRKHGRSNSLQGFEPCITLNFPHCDGRAFHVYLCSAPYSADNMGRALELNVLTTVGRVAGLRRSGRSTALTAWEWLHGAHSGVSHDVLCPLCFLPGKMRVQLATAIIESILSLWPSVEGMDDVDEYMLR